MSGDGERDVPIFLSRNSSSLAVARAFLDSLSISRDLSSSILTLAPLTDRRLVTLSSPSDLISGVSLVA
jgi:hypothetical protein